MMAAFQLHTRCGMLHVTELVSTNQAESRQVEAPMGSKPKRVCGWEAKAVES